VRLVNKFPSRLYLFLLSILEIVIILNFLKEIVCGVTGSKASVTVQPFLVLHLDILYEAVHNVEDALKLFAAPETLEGYKTMAGKVKYNPLQNFLLTSYMLYLSQ
jgi:ubiquitin C-terminal hydrolase